MSEKEKKSANSEVGLFSLYPKETGLPRSHRTARRKLPGCPLPGKPVTKQLTHREGRLTQLATTTTINDKQIYDNEEKIRTKNNEYVRENSGAEKKNRVNSDLRK